MSRDDLVDVPEYALGEERIAFGLTAPQLAVLVGAGLLAAFLNLLPLWAPAKLGLIALIVGPAAFGAVLQIRGEPAYRWLLRAVRYWRSPKVWRPVVVDDAESSKPAVSGAVEDGPMPSTSGGPVRAVNAFGPPEEGAVEPGPDNGDAAASELAAPSPPANHPAPEERGDMDGKVVRLHPERPDLTEGDSDLAPHGEEQQPPSPPLPYVFPIPRLVCLLSFAGGVGKTSLAVELATYLATNARYRVADGTAHGVEVLLIDAARLAPAAGLRLGLSARALSEAWRWVDRRDADAVAGTIREVRDHLSLLTLAPDPTFLGAEPGGPPEAEFTASHANAIVDAARRAGSVLAIADLGTRFEPGHVRLIEQAELVVGVSRPTVESLPDLYRLSEWLRRVGVGRKVGFVANQCADDAEVASIAREVGAPLLGTIPTSAALARAGERGEAGWPHDPVLATGIARLAGALWPLGVSTATRRSLARLALDRLGGVLRRSG
jgi:Mrp family chromosome partitioning ATPase